MDVDYPIAVSILISYFVLILALLWRVKSQLSKTLSSSTPGISLFHLLAFVSFIATWTYMIKFFTFSYREWKAMATFTEPVSLNSISYWLHDVSLFDSAWRQVCVGVWQWLWSHQLCSLTVSVWTPILAIEGNFSLVIRFDLLTLYQSRYATWYSLCLGIYDLGSSSGYFGCFLFVFCSHAGLYSSNEQGTFSKVIKQFKLVYCRWYSHGDPVTICS